MMLLNWSPRHCAAFLLGARDVDVTVYKADCNDWGMRFCPVWGSTGSVFQNSRRSQDRVRIQVRAWLSDKLVESEHQERDVACILADSSPDVGWKSAYASATYPEAGQALRLAMLYTLRNEIAKLLPLQAPREGCISDFEAIPQLLRICIAERVQPL
jgi:hypothetical protein